jgi:hypothetical protein
MVVERENLTLHQMNVKLVFLNEYLEEGITQPKESIKLGPKHLVCRLKDAFYDL